MTPDTRILTYDLKWLPIGEIKVGNKILAFDEYGRGKSKNGRSIPRKLRESIVEGIKISPQPVYAITMADGTVIKSTLGHKWFGWFGKKNRAIPLWFKTKDVIERLKKNKKVLFGRPVLPWGVPNDYDRGFIESGFDGEGHISFNKRANNFAHLVFTQRENLYMQKMRTVLERNNFKTYTQKQKTRSASQLQIMGGFWEFARLIGSYRPERFIKKWTTSGPVDGFDMAPGKHRIEAVRAEYVGVQDIVRIKTSTKTLIAEGFCSHNCYELSYFEKIPTSEESFLDEISLGKQLLRKIREVCPNARIIFIPGNHEHRLITQIVANLPALYGLPALTLQSLLDLNTLGIEYIKTNESAGWNGDYIVHDGFMIGHFKRVSKHSAYTAKALVDDFSCSVIQAHVHRGGVYYKTLPDGRTLTGIEGFCMCDLHPSYMLHANWQGGWVDLREGQPELHHFVE